jgi:DNA-binding MarR family transcriptional regulator
VSLTDEGLRALESAQSVAVAAVAMLLEPLKPDELDSLVRGIEILHGLGAPDSEICR